MKIRRVVAAACGIGLAVGATGLHFVQENDVAVLQYRWGHVRSVAQKGWNWRNPITTKLSVHPLGIQHVDFPCKFTSDFGHIETRVTVSYVVPIDVLLSDERVEHSVPDMLERFVRSAVRAAAAEYPALGTNFDEAVQRTVWAHAAMHGIGVDRVLISPPFTRV